MTLRVGFAGNAGFEDVLEALDVSAMRGVDSDDAEVAMAGCRVLRLYWRRFRDTIADRTAGASPLIYGVHCVRYCRRAWPER